MKRLENQILELSEKIEKLSDIWLSIKSLDIRKESVKNKQKTIMHLFLEERIIVTNKEKDIVAIESLRKEWINWLENITKEEIKTQIKGKIEIPHDHFFPKSFLKILNETYQIESKKTRPSKNLRKDELRKEYFTKIKIK